MTIKQRLEAIRKIVKTETRVVVSELSKQFDVTEETIRRDLYKLETEGLVTRTYGGAILNQNITYENVDYRRREQTNPEEKREIASLAASVIPWNTTVSADGSSTVAEALKMLADHEGLTILTYSIKAIDNLADSDIRLVSTAVTLESVAEFTKLFSNIPGSDFEVTMIQSAKSRKAGPYHLMNGGNPVYIFSVTLKKAEQ